MKIKLKNLVIILLLVSLVVSVLYCSNGFSKNIFFGTYISTNQEASDESLYIVFEYDGHYVKYHQFKVLEYGIYESLEDEIYILKNSNIKNATQSLIYYGDKIYLVNEFGNIEVFKKISNVPTYINVERPEFNK